MTYDHEEPREGDPRYAPPDSISGMDLFNALRKLHLIDGDIFMCSQVHNLAIVDDFLTKLEYQIRDKWIQEERTPQEAYFLSAQSQMWIFAAYELLRTWKQRTHEFIKMSTTNTLQKELDALKVKQGAFLHLGLELRINQLEAAIARPAMIDELIAQLRHLHIPYGYLEYIRISLAKHEIKGKNKSIALSPGGGRINTWCGAMDYELEDGQVSMGYINRRDIADSIRHLDLSQEPPTPEVLKDFDDHLRGRHRKMAVQDLDWALEDIQ